MSEANSEPSGSNSGSDSGGEKKEKQVVKTTILRGLFREEFDLRVSDEAEAEMVDILNELSRKIWQTAEGIAERDDRGTVKARDVEDAYQQVLKPHNMLHQAVGRVEDVKLDLEDIADQSPFTSRVDDD